jgi:hypothetical protein
MRITNLLIVFIVIAVFAGIAAADSYALYCIPEGQVLDFAQCNPAMGKLTGYVETCVHLTDTGKICPAHPNTCNSLGLKCSGVMNTSTDVSAPNLTVMSPKNNTVYNEKGVYLNLKTDESSNIYYLDNINGRGRWTQVCTSCTSYNKKRNFNEGLNDLTFKATDKSGQSSYYNASFRIDSKKPKINKAEPKKGFSDGMVSVQFTEDNPVNLSLYYGNGESGMKNQRIDLNTCVIDKGKYNCNSELELNNYDNEQISYWFVLTDIAGNSVSSKVNTLSVDMTFPTITSFNYTIKGTKVTFNMSVNDANFDEITYMDNSAARPSERILCSSLKNGYCVKGITFSKGIHDLNIQVYDSAGNSIAESVFLEII